MPARGPVRVTAMSYATETVRTRPGVVTAAATLLHAGAAVQVLGLVVQLAQFPALRGFLDDEISASMR